MTYAFILSSFLHLAILAQVFINKANNPVMLFCSSLGVFIYLVYIIYKGFYS